jgi:inorganic pyrophosphatase
MKARSSQAATGGESSHGPVIVVVETPRGNHNKYKYDEKTGRIKLSKVMPEGMMFPYDFGFLPETRSEDGDPLDVLILSDAPTFPGCQIDCRLIGVIKAEQTENAKQSRNDRLIAVAEASVLYSGVHELSDLEPIVVQQIEDFFVNYQKVRNIEFAITGREGARSAEQVHQAARQNPRGKRKRAA